MKFIFPVLAVVLFAQTHSASADVGIRNISCYADFNGSLIYSGDYWVIEQPDFKPIVARKIHGSVAGKCQLGEVESLPMCISQFARVYIGKQPCVP